MRSTWKWILPLALMVFAASGALAADKNAGKSKAAPAAAAPVDSLVVLEKMVAKDSTKYDNVYRLGIYYMDRDKLPQAIKVFSKAVQLRPKSVPAIVNLGAAYDASGNASQAQVHYRKALEISPTDSVAICRLASSLYTTGESAKAVKMLTELVKKQPRAFCAYFTLGVAFADAGIYKDAIRMWRKVVEIDPTSPEAMSARESIEMLERYAPPDTTTTKK